MPAPTITSPPTQADIARHCNVSRSTVAAVLRGEPSVTGVNEQTYERVMVAVRELGYRPNAAASTLRSGRTHTVAVAVPNMTLTSRVVAPMILEGVGDQAHKLGYVLNVVCYEESKDHRTSLQRLLRESRFDGVFVYALSDQVKDPRAEVLADSGIPFVSLEGDHARASWIRFDHQAGSYMAVKHLIDSGRKRIAIIKRKSKVAWSTQRYEGYVRALKEAGRSVEKKLVVDMPESDLAEMGIHGMEKLIGGRAKFDAVFCISDYVALGALQALRKHGLNTPDDVAVIGYDDMPMAALAYPPLTTVRQNGVELGRQAMDMLDTLISNKSTRHLKRTVPVELVIRESCGGATGIK